MPTRRAKRYAWVTLSRTMVDTSDVARLLGTIHALAGQGYADTQIADVVGVSRSTARRYRLSCDEILRLARTIEEVSAGVSGVAVVGADPSTKAAQMRAAFERQEARSRTAKRSSTPSTTPRSARKR